MKYVRINNIMTNQENYRRIFLSLKILNFTILTDKKKDKIPSSD